MTFHGIKRSPRNIVLQDGEPFEPAPPFTRASGRRCHWAFGWGPGSNPNEVTWLALSLLRAQGFNLAQNHPQFERLKHYIMTRPDE